MIHAIRDFFVTLFLWPSGIVVGNLLASFLWVPVAFLAGYLFRNRLMKHLVRLHHKHKTLHEAELKRRDEANG